MNASTFKLAKPPLHLTPPNSRYRWNPDNRPTPGQRLGVTDSMVTAVIFIATIYWFLDSVLNIFFSNRYNLVAELFGPHLYDIYLRVVVLCLFIIFGSHAQSIISRLQKTKQQLDESEQLWRSLVATAPDSIMTVDRQGIVRFTNRDHSAQTPAGTVGRSFYRSLPSNYRDLARECIESVFQTGESESFEVQTGHHRSSRWYTYRIGALKLNGQVIAATIISSDTTEFKRAEELARYKELLDNVAEGVFLFRPNGKFIESNDRILESTGYSKNEFLKLNVAQIVEADQVGPLENILNKVRADKEMRFEMSIKTRDGRLIPNEINCRFVYYLGKPCFLCVARDVTETKMLQNQLIRSERLAATGQLAASIAHEINSPLQGITALLTVITASHRQDEELMKKLELIKKAFTSIRNTVKNLIELNRPTSESKQPMNVNEVIENTLTLIRSHLKKNQVQVNLNLAAKTADINGSPQQIGQVVMNLVNNAVEAICGAPNAERHPPAGGKGEIRIETRDGEDAILITVRDNGPGISEQHLEHIFDPFFTRKKAMGMGVGLSICHDIIEAHGGSITAANAPEDGAVVTIRLPRQGDNAPRSKRVQ